ncbi:MAG: hypothetical protein ACRDTG_31995 [Pseudonocardiaceae bacterium]
MRDLEPPAPAAAVTHPPSSWRPRTGDRVLLRTPRPPWLVGTGLVVGPDQTFFPRPDAVHVLFPTGMVRLIDVHELVDGGDQGP